MTGMVLTGLRVLGGPPGNLAIADGVIVAGSAVRDDWRRVDCSGLVALPALVDPHTHLRDPGVGDAEDIASGSVAAARGGYGAVFAMANTVPVADTVEIVEYEKRRGDEVGLVDLYPIGAVTVGLKGERLSDIAGMAASAARVRMFSDDGVCIARSDVMRDALLAIRDVGGVLAEHSQDPLLTAGSQVDAGIADRVGLPGWPTMAETVIVARDAIMAAELGARVHCCHVSTAATVEVVRWAKAQGFPITAEATPHHLSLSHELATTGNPQYKVNPPLRSLADIEALREALIDGTIDMVGTDHAPHPPGRKAAEWCDAAMGMLGLETALAIVADAMVATGRMSWVDVAERMSSAPARLLGISDVHGGDLAVGRPATLCLIDENRPWTVRGQELASIASNTPYEELSYSTRVVATMLRGAVTFDLDHRLPPTTA